MLAWEYPPTQQQVHRRVSVAARYEYPFVSDALLIVPQHGNPMRGIFAAQPDELRKHLGAYMLKPDEAYSGDGLALLQLWTKAVRKLALHHLRVNPKVDQDAPAYDSLDC